jgi:hypothetical protein
VDVLTAIQQVGGKRMKTQKPPQPLPLGIQPALSIMPHIQLLQEALNHSDWIKLPAIENWDASVKGFRH